MPDDPREVLRAAGVECAEVEEYLDDGKHNFLLHGGFGIRYIRESKADKTILALARLAADGARYKWQRDECADELGRKLAVDYKYEATKPFAASDVIVDLDRRWKEHDA